MPKYMVTYNQPGYLPESEPIYADSVEEAIEAYRHVVEDILEAGPLDTAGLKETILRFGGVAGTFATPEGIWYAVDIDLVPEGNGGGEI